MTALEIFYLTGSLFFILLTIAIVVIGYYVVKTLTVIRFAVVDLTGLFRLLTNKVGKFQLGAVTFLLGLLRTFILRK